MTGASRGFGRCVAEEFIRQVAPSNPVDLVLVARSESGLRSATDAIDDMARSIGTQDGGADVDVVVRREALDLGDLDHLEAGLEGVFSRIGESCSYLAEAAVGTRHGLSLTSPFSGIAIHNTVLQFKAALPMSRQENSSELIFFAPGSVKRPHNSKKPKRMFEAVVIPGSC